MRKINLLIKRLFDIAASGLGLLLLSPLFLLFSIWIKLDSEGPVFFLQNRLGYRGKTFRLIKFRTMVQNSEHIGEGVKVLSEKDPRITKSGRVLRKTSIDELPQLINVLLGDMSIVGPRPERPEIAEQYKQYLPEFDLRLQCKCGLTGFAQVYGQYNTTPYDKLLMDLMYIAKPSIAEDFKICFATVKILFMPESTEGVAVGATTAMDYENAADSTENDAETIAK